MPGLPGPDHLPGRLPGLYLVESDANGRRHFHYWRGESPARELFELAEWPALCEALLKAKLIYFSGITLSLYSNTGIGRFLALIEVARQQGAKIVFDGNFRPRDWRGDIARSRTVFMEALKRYLSRKKLRPTAWARANGIAPPVISRYLNGKTGLSPENALRIERATDGEVTRLELLYPDTGAAA